MREHAHFRCPFPHEGISSLEGILYHPVKNGILYSLLELTYGIAWFDTEEFHHIIAGDRILEIAYRILLLHFHQFLLHEFEIRVQSRHLAWILRRDIRVAQKHKVIDIIAGIEKKPAHS